ncbi:MAG: hypothetical protein ACRD27_08300, partial [Terracidiphilus sp.]
MNPPGKNPSANFSAASMHPVAPPAGAVDDAEATLRLIASLPVPAGLEDRVFSGVMSAGVLATPRGGRVLQWRRRLGAGSLMRGAAAAAIVFAVAGGGWGIYSRVERRQAARVIVMPPRAVQPGSFSSAGAVRTPKTIPGPVVERPAVKTP